MPCPILKQRRAWSPDCRAKRLAMNRPRPVLLPLAKIPTRPIKIGAGHLAFWGSWQLLMIGVAAFLYRMGEPTLSLVAGPDLGPA